MCLLRKPFSLSLSAIIKLTTLGQTTVMRSDICMTEHEKHKHRRSFQCQLSAISLKLKQTLCCPLLAKQELVRLCH